jgi:hypothetical protein
MASLERDEPSVQPPGLAGRPFDGRPQVGLLHALEQVQTALDEVGELRVRGHLTEAVGP